MGSFSHLVLLATSLALGTLFFAFLPLYFRLSPRHVAAVSQASVGVLVGAALAVILPEGVAAVFEAAEHGDEGGHARQGGEDRSGDGHAHGNAGWIGAALLAGFILMYIIDSLHGHDEYTSGSSPAHDPSSRRTNTTLSSHHSSSRLLRPSYRPTPSHLAELEPLSTHGSARNSNEYTPSSAPLRVNGGAEAWDIEAASVGDEPPSPPHGHSHSLGLGMHHDEDQVMTADASSVSTVIGLLAHSLADGVSLGASSLSSSSSSSTGDSLQLIIFLSIILHKAPTAFALSSLLSSSPSTSPSFTRRALLLFSLAAPLGALLTYLLLSLLGARTEGAGLEWWTGLALVFSGGTFLFVATHAVKEQENKAARTGGGGSQSGHRQHEGEDGWDGGEGAEEEALSERARMALMIGGMVFPGLLGRLVGHGH
ncbi:hypothetical protein JCM11251_001060 [Rhodosporidiobolus azoricus]